MRHVMASDNEAELGGFFENYQKATTMRTALEEMGQSKSPKPVANGNKTENKIVNGTKNR